MSVRGPVAESRLTLEQCRVSLGKRAEGMTDAEVLALRDEFDAAAGVLIGLRDAMARAEADRRAGRVAIEDDGVTRGARRNAGGRRGR